MQFRYSVIAPSADVLARVFKPLDPEVKIALDSRKSVVEILSSTITVERIVSLLGEMGCKVEPLEELTHISGGSTCCGGCA